MVVLMLCKGSKSQQLVLSEHFEELGIESDINSELREKNTKHNQEVNKAMAFHSIKRKAFDLIISGKPLEFVIPELAKLFKLNPTVKRHGRSKKNRKSQPSAKRQTFINDGKNRQFSLT